MFRLEQGTESGAPTARLRAVPDPAPRLFQLKEQRRSLWLPLCLAIALHAELFLVVASGRPPAVVSPSAEVPVVFRKPKPPPPSPRLPERSNAGGSPARGVRRRPLKAPPPLPTKSPPELPPPEPVAELDDVDDAEDEDSSNAPTGAPDGTGLGGVGTGTGKGIGSGTDLVPAKSKARKAWLVRTDWRCSRPGYDDLGRVVVRIRVEVLLNGKPGNIVVVKPGPDAFNRRAIDCARAEEYLPALDAEGHPIPGDAEFGIDFRL